MTRTRARADERNEKTDSVTKERRRIRNLETEVLELRAWKAERLQAEEDTEEECERLAGLLEAFAASLEDRDPALIHGDVISFGAGVNARTLLAADLYRSAELIDPDD